MVSPDIDGNYWRKEFVIDKYLVDFIISGFYNISTERRMPDPGESFYDILNVRRDASQEEIATSYRKLAKILHPDVCGSPEAEELFKSLNEAYQTLRDPKKRSSYDTALAISESSPYSEYHRGYKQYRHPGTWYYTRTTNNYHKDSEKSHQPSSGDRMKRSQKKTLPRIIQVILFYSTFFMGAVILAELFLIPWIAGINAADAREAFAEGSGYLEEGEYLKAIESFSIATNKDPGFSLAWMEKGYAEIKKGDEMTQINREIDAREYYESAVRSFSHLSPGDSESGQVLIATGTAFLNLGEYEKASFYLKKAQEKEPINQDLNDLMYYASNRINPQTDRKIN